MAGESRQLRRLIIRVGAEQIGVGLGAPGRRRWHRQGPEQHHDPDLVGDEGHQLRQGHDLARRKPSGAQGVDIGLRRLGREAGEQIGVTKDDPIARLQPTGPAGVRLDQMVDPVAGPASVRSGMGRGDQLFAIPFPRRPVAG